MFNVACGNGFPLGIPTGDGGGGGASTAENVSYDNSDSGLTAENVQAAIDELAGDLDDVNDLIPATASAENQLATMADIGGEKTTTLTPTENETYGEILARLRSAIVFSKVTPNTKLVVVNGSRLDLYFPRYLNDGNYIFLQVPSFGLGNEESRFQILLANNCTYGWFKRAASDGALTAGDYTNNTCNWDGVYIQY